MAENRTSKNIYFRMDMMQLVFTPFPELRKSKLVLREVRFIIYWRFKKMRWFDPLAMAIRAWLA
jgi:hypothetical protein